MKALATILLASVILNSCRRSFEQDLATRHVVPILFDEADNGVISVKKERFKRVRSAASTRKEVNQIVFDEQRPSTLQQALLSRPSTGQSRKNRRDMYLSTQHELPPLNVKSNHLRVLPP